MYLFISYYCNCKFQNPLITLEQNIVGSLLKWKPGLWEKRPVPVGFFNNRDPCDELVKLARTQN